jgi:Fic family protein
MKEKYRIAETNNRKLLALRPLPPETLQSLRDYYRIALTFSSNALEGNSLTESETKVVIEDGLTIEGKPLRDVYEAVGHAKAYDYLYHLVTNKTLKEEDILLLHKMFYSQIDQERAGTYRDVPVFITGS